VELEGEDEIGKEGLVQVGKGREAGAGGARPEGSKEGVGRGEREREGWMRRRGGEKDGSVDNWKGSKGRKRKKQAKRPGRAGGRVCCGEGGREGGRRERTPGLTGWLAADGERGERESKGGAYKTKGWWRMYCRVVRMCISIYPPCPDLLTPFAFSQHGTQRRAPRQSLQRPLHTRSLARSIDRIVRRFYRSNLASPLLHEYVYRIVFVCRAPPPRTDQ